MALFEGRTWSRKHAVAIIALSILAAILTAYYRHSQGALDIPEVVILILLLLAILPPNFALLLRKPDRNSPPAPIHSRHTRTP